jgi:hypothetical protein
MIRTGSTRGRANETVRPAVVFALPLAAAIVLAACGWYLLHSGPPTLRVAAPSASVEPSDASGPRRELPPPDSIAVAMVRPDRASVASSDATDAPAPGVAATPRPQTLVHGRLLDESHAAIASGRSARLCFVDRSGWRRATDATSEGTYALHELEFGTYWVTASADGYRSVEETVELRSDRPSLQMDFKLQKCVALRVRVTTPGGESLLDVLESARAPRGARLLVAVATREPPGKRFEEGTGRLDERLGVGRFKPQEPCLEGNRTDCLGTLLLDRELPVFVSLVHCQWVLQTKRVAGSEDEVTFVVSPDELLADLATIRAQVVDAATGSPIHAARVTLGSGTCFDPGVATDPQGIATIARREPGRFDLMVSASGYGHFRQSIDALPGELTDLGTVRLEQEVTVEGRVLDLDGRPLAASFSLGIVDPTDRSIRWFRSEECRSRGDGSLAIRGLGRGEYVIRTSNHDARDESAWTGVPWVSGNVAVDTRAGPITGLEIELRPAARLVVQEVSGVIGDDLRFRVVDELGRELLAGRLHGTEPRPLSLPAGSYVVSLLDASGAPLSEQSVDLGSETVEVALSR